MPGNAKAVRKPTARTTIAVQGARVQFDSDWKQRQSWVYPAEVVSRLSDYSISGGVFTRDGKLL